MKKLLSVMLAAVILLAALCMPAMAEDEEFYIPRTVTGRHFDSMVMWDDVEGEPDQIALLAAAVMKDMEAGLGEAGFDPDDVNDVIVFSVMGFVFVNYYDSQWDWLVSPLGNEIGVTLIRDSIGHSDPIAFAETQIARGNYDAYAYVTSGEIAAAMTRVAEAESVSSGGDLTAYFRNAEDVGPFRCGLANFNYQETGAFIRPDGTIVSNPDWDYCRPFVEDGAVGVVYSGPFSYGYPSGGVYGLVDADGNALTEMVYSGVDICGDNMLSLKKDGVNYYYNAATNEIFTLTGFDATAWRCNDGLIPVYEGPLNAEGEPEGGKWGYADFEGNVVIPIEWDSVGWMWYYDHAIVTRNGLDGLINRAGELVIPCEWESLSDVNDGLLLAEDGSLAYVLTFDGAVVGTFDAEYVSLNDYGYVSTYVEFNNDGALWLADGTAVLDAEWYDIAVLSETIVRLGVRDANKNRTYGIYDLETGEWIQPLIWTEISGEYDGMRRVMRNGMYGYLDADFNEVIPARFEDADDFNGGYACVMQGGQWYIIDKTGTIVF